MLRTTLQGAFGIQRVPAVKFGSLGQAVWGLQLLCGQKDLNLGVTVNPQCWAILWLAVQVRGWPRLGFRSENCK